MPSTLRGIFMMVTVMLMCCSIDSYERDPTRKRNIYRRQRPRLMRNRFEALRRQQLLAMQNLEGNSEWSQLFVPDIPNAEDVDCNIEVEVTEVIGGRCVRLGGAGRLAVCQSGMYLDVHNDECQHILTTREMNEQFMGVSPQQSEQQSQLSQTVSENDVVQHGVSDNGAMVGEDISTESRQEA